VLAQTSMIVDDLSAGRLVLPFPVGVALPSPYFLTWQASSFDQPHCRAFHRWILTQQPRTASAQRPVARSVALLGITAQKKLFSRWCSR
jgi:hypothetical protein